MMCAIDMDAGKVWWGFNGEWGDVGSGTGNPATGANASNTWTVANYTDHIFPFTLSWANPDAEIIMNCGQDGTFAGHITAGGNADDTGYGNFKYDVPAGFLSLCTGNLPVVDEVESVVLLKVTIPVAFKLTALSTLFPVRSKVSPDASS